MMQAAVIEKNYKHLSNHRHLQPRN